MERAKTKTKLFAAWVALAFVTGMTLSLVGCALDQDFPREGNAHAALSGQPQGEVLTVSAVELKADLPGCLEALNDPSAEINGAAELRYIQENENLALLSVGGNQVCVDDAHSLEHWLFTGKWPKPTDLADLESSPKPPDVPSGASLQSEAINTGRERVQKASNIVNDPRTSVSGPVDDSNPLPPYPLPER